MEELHKASGLIQINNKLTEMEHKVFNYILKNAMTDIYSKKGKIIKDFENPFGDIDKEDFKSFFIKEMKENKEFYSTFSEIKQVMGISHNRYIKEALNGLSTKLITTQDLLKEKKGWTTNFAFLSYWEFDKEEEMLNFRLNEKLVDLIIKSISEDKFIFAKINLAIQSKIKSKHGLWLYELLKDYSGLEKVSFNITELRYLSGIEENEYKQITDFIKRVIIPAIEEINKKTDIEIHFEKIKKGRSVSKIMFHIQKNNKSEIIKEFMFRIFWTTLLKDRVLPIKKKNLRVMPKEQNKSIILINEATNKPFSVEESREIYDYVYKQKEEFYKNLFERFEINEDMATELNNYFFNYAHLISEKNKKQFEKYTKGIDKTDIW